MDETKLFEQYGLFSSRWENYFILTVFVLLIALILRFLSSKSKAMPQNYRVDLAWLQAGIFFCICFIIAWFSGVFQTIVNMPLISSENLSNPVWISYTIVCIVVEFVAYWIIWPKGTLTHGRPLILAAIIPFGLLWGISEGMLFLAFWALIEIFITSKLIVGVLSFIIISTFLGLWHSQYWDIHVSPEHNIEEWNTKKVLFAHIPNLLITLPYLAIFGNAGLFVLFQTIALVGSAYFMRFPPFWQNETQQA